MGIKINIYFNPLMFIRRRPTLLYIHEITIHSMELNDMSKPMNLPRDLPATGYVRVAQLIPAILPFSSGTLWRKVKAGTFPRPVKLSERVTAWPAEAIREWMAERAVA